MERIFWARVSPNGSLGLPSTLRRELGLTPGTVVYLRRVGNTIQLVEAGQADRDAHRPKLDDSARDSSQI